MKTYENATFSQALLELDRYADAEEAANSGIEVQANNQHLARVRRKAREAICLQRLCGLTWATWTASLPRLSM